MRTSCSKYQFLSKENLKGAIFNVAVKKIGIFHQNKEVTQLAELETLMGHHCEFSKGSASAYVWKFWCMHVSLQRAIVLVP